MSSQKIGRYEIIRELGRGGMATVFLASDPFFGRWVAVKVLPAQFTHDPQFRMRFAREAKVIAALEHPYIVPVYDYGEEGDQPFIVMRFMPGGTLTRHIADGPMPLVEAVPIVQRVADALACAHRRGIIHRDLKPDNILFDGDGHAFLSDFGIAKLLESTSAFTGSGVIGTPAYMSPEQAGGDKAVDSRCDIYALGIILYEMLTGRHPYKTDDVTTPIRLILRHMTEPIPVIDTAAFNLPGECNTVLTRALAKKPDERYASATEFAQAVAVLLSLAPTKPKGGVAVQIVTPSPPPAVVTPVNAAVVSATRVQDDHTLTKPPEVVPAPSEPTRSAGQTPPPAQPNVPARPLPGPAARPAARISLWVLAALGGGLLLFLVLLAGVMLGSSWSGWGSGLTDTPTPTLTVMPSQTSLPVMAASPTVPPTLSASATPAPTASRTFTPLPTAMATATPISTATPTRTSTRRPTHLPPTLMPVPTATDIPLPTPTNTPEPANNPPPPPQPCPAPP